MHDCRLADTTHARAAVYGVTSQLATIYTVRRPPRLGRDAGQQGLVGHLVPATV
jgi:hypothetical protein